ncbi:hypothetical protein GCM10027422_02380 [Hymenobacter arcticus]
MKKPAVGILRWQRDGRTVYLYARDTSEWPALVGPVFFTLVLCIPNPWVPIFAGLLVGPGFGLNAIGLIRLTFWGLLGFWVLVQALLLLSHEMVAIGQGTVLVRRQCLKWVFYYRRFRVHDIRRVEVRELSEIGFEGGTLRFHTANEIITFGRTVQPAEARLALEELARLGALPVELVAPALGATAGLAPPPRPTSIPSK